MSMGLCGGGTARRSGEPCSTVVGTHPCSEGKGLAMRHWAKVSLLIGCLAALWPAAAPAQDSGFSPQQMARKEWSLDKSGQVRDTTDVDERGAPIAEPSPFEDRAAEKRVA